MMVFQVTPDLPDSNETEVCHEHKDYIDPILYRVKFWIEGVCLVIVATVGLGPML
jgi:hypothetical protein